MAPDFPQIFKAIFFTGFKLTLTEIKWFCTNRLPPINVKIKNKSNSTGVVVCPILNLVKVFLINI
jgi:hypothetical protein